ncbi:MAG: hypothetical protein PHS57_01435 [Alphaproteobacteria bacterium]|nr:hypothetical protein [Alphaproteobacteria bacterium]
MKRSFLCRICMGVVLGMGAWGSGVAVAEDLVRLSPELRLTYAQTDRMEASQNVTIKLVKMDALPRFILEDIRDKILQCGDRSDPLADVQAYSWLSSRALERKLPPNYLIDLGEVGVGKETCPEPICTDEGCLLLGYTPVDTNTWRQDFSLRATRFGFTQKSLKDSTVQQTEIQTLSNRPMCRSLGGQNTNEGCFRRFLWRNYGLIIISPL